MRLQMALIQRDQIEDIAILGHLSAERLGRAERLGVPPTLRELAYAPHFELDRGRLRRGGLRSSGGRIHAGPSNKEGGHCCPPSILRHPASRLCGSAGC